MLIVKLIILRNKNQQPLCGEWWGLNKLVSNLHILEKNVLDEGIWGFDDEGYLYHFEIYKK